MIASYVNTLWVFMVLYITFIQKVKIYIACPSIQTDKLVVVGKQCVITNLQTSNEIFSQHISLYSKAVFIEAMKLFDSNQSNYKGSWCQYLA